MTRQRSKSIGGIIHTYQRYDPQRFPSPTEPPPDLVSPAFEHMLAYGSLRELTDEQLARAIHLDPSQIAGLGPSIESLLAMLREQDDTITSFDFRAHDLRRTASTRMAKAGIPKIDISRVLNHSEGGPQATDVYVKYQYEKEKTVALESWERILVAILDGATSAADVIPISKGRS